MFAIICGFIETTVSVFVNLFAAGYVVGRIIAHVLSNIGDAVVAVVKILASFAVTFYEDVKIFLLDIDYQYGHILKMFNTGINNSISDVSRMVFAVTSSIAWISEQTKSEVQKTVIGIVELFAFSLIGIRDWIILVGNSVWMLLMCIPNLTILILHSLLKICAIIFEIIAETIHLSAALAYDSLCNLVEFFTFVPIQSICGLFVIGLLIKYRQQAFRPLRALYQAMARLIRYVLLKLTDCIQSTYTLSMTPIISLWNSLPPIWRLSPTEEDYANPSSTTSPSKNIGLNNCCVICQDKIKSIVLLPCRHLCLCQDCFRQLRRYREQCPMCRVPYEHSIQVYA